MSSKIQQIPVWRACENCRYRRRKCPHKHAVLLPLKAGGPDATFRLVTDPALIALAVSPSKVRKAPTPNKKRRRVSGGRVKVRRKAVKEDGGEWDEGEDREEGREEMEVKTGEELHGTISVRHFPQMPIQYNPPQRQGPSPKYLPLKLSSMEKSKEKLDITPTASQNGGGERLNLAPKADYRTNERLGADTSKLVDKILEDRLAGQTVEKEGKNCSDSPDEETTQLAIAPAIETNSHHHRHPLGNAKEVGKTIKVPKHSKKPLEKHGDEEISQQSSHQNFTSSDDKTGFYQPPIHTGLLHNENSESKLDQEPQLELELHRPEPTTLQLLEPQSPTPSIEFTHLAQSPRPQRPQLPLTPASINPTPPPLPSAHPVSSLASTGAGSTSPSYVTGPARWKLPCAKKSRFSGPKIYTPLTLHPPSGGLGVVDSKTPLRRDEIDIRWERTRRQISEEL